MKMKARDLDAKPTKLILSAVYTFTHKSRYIVSETYFSALISRVCN
jgi:hypothetical protein